jgi:hypothetical protein
MDHKLILSEFDPFLITNLPTTNYVALRMIRVFGYGNQSHLCKIKIHADKSNERLAFFIKQMSKYNTKNDLLSQSECESWLCFICYKTKNMNYHDNGLTLCEKCFNNFDDRSIYVANDNKYYIVNTKGLYIWEKNKNVCIYTQIKCIKNRNSICNINNFVNKILCHYCRTFKEVNNDRICLNCYSYVKIYNLRILLPIVFHRICLLPEIKNMIFELYLNLAFFNFLK